MPHDAIPPPVRAVPRLAWRQGAGSHAPRFVPEETPVALTYNRATHAVMLATPADLADFALGFSLAERIVTAADQITALEIVPLPDGVELRMDLVPDRLDALTWRQRRMAGPSGCGLCGMDSLAAAVPEIAPVSSTLCVTPQEIAAALATLPAAQVLHRQTHAVHAAGFWTPAAGLIALREDIGRHNALDKLIGARAGAGADGAGGILVLSSRVSVELVQKAAILGAPVLVAVSAPTALAIRTAERANITLVGIARTDGFEVFTHPERIQPEPVPHVA